MVSSYTIEAEAGAKLIDTTHVALHRSLTGFEFCMWNSRECRWSCFHECWRLWWRNRSSWYLVGSTPEGEIKDDSAEVVGYRSSSNSGNG